MKKAAKSTTRGVVVIDKAGKVQVWEQAGPQKTVDAVMGYVQAGGHGTAAAAPPAAPASDTTMADAPTATEPAVASTETAPPISTGTEPATSSETAIPASTESQPSAAVDLPPAMGSATAAQQTAHAEALPADMDEVPLTKEASKEEVHAAETAAEVGETAAKIDSTEDVKA